MQHVRASSVAQHIALQQPCRRFHNITAFLCVDDFLPLLPKAEESFPRISTARQHPIKFGKPTSGSVSEFSP